MKQHYIDEKTGISYTLQGDYYLPDFVLPAEGNRSVGVWGQRHLRYLKQHRKVFYTNLLTSGKLRSYLADIDEQAETMFFRLAEQMAQHDGITESLKASDQMAWVQKMNNIRNAARKIVYAELIYR
ncbi:MAG: TnpV protein [Clostridiales bacterium]|nr:MAG: TnpV protein [Clostridiales bacterium]